MILSGINRSFSGRDVLEKQKWLPYLSLQDFVNTTFKAQLVPPIHSETPGVTGRVNTNL